MRILPVATLLLLLAGPPVSADPASEVVGILRQAEDLHAEALAREHGWSVTTPLLERAREALEAGDLERARELADRALLMAGRSLEQALSEAENWRDRVVRE